MVARSAGILMYRRRGEDLEVLLVHPGGPFWRGKDFGAWSIPKGEWEPGEDAEAAARREFAEELGVMPTGELQPVGEVRQSGGKRVVAFALEGDLDADAIRSNEFELEWPPRSGRVQKFPEVDRAAWFALPVARAKMIAGQRPLLDLLRTSAAPRG
jgi:predicted NUDIX family NTP pyrophosphohydrolase